MKITKISLRQELAKAIMDVADFKVWDLESWTDDDIFAQALIVLLRRIE